MDTATWLFLQLFTLNFRKNWATQNVNGAFKNAGIHRSKKRQLNPFRFRENLIEYRKIGYLVDHQTGSHMIRRLTIPDHTEFAKGTLHSIIHDAGLTVDEYSALL